MNNEKIAEAFMLMGIQEWGQSNEKRAAATAVYLTAAGFNVEPSGFPVFGGMFPQQPIKGPDGESAHAWLDGVLSAPGWRGRFQDEVKHLVAALDARASPSPEQGERV